MAVTTVPDSADVNYQWDKISDEIPPVTYSGAITLREKRMTYNCLHDIKNTREAQGILVLIDIASITGHLYF